MEYKASRYNYFTRNPAGELLMFNTYHGRDSFIKASGEQADRMEEGLSAQGNLALLKEEEIPLLAEKGFLVPEDEDELVKLKLLRYNTVKDRILNITILTTGQCNFRCTYCYESFRQEEMSPELQEAVIRFVKRNIDRYTGLNIGWFGGEPLCGFSVIENLSKAFMEICRQKGKPYMANMTTNGYLLDFERFKQLKKWNVLHYQITIDGLRETHNRQKPLAGGGDTFDRVIHNLEEIRDREKSKMVHITIRTNISREIQTQLKEYQKFYGEKFGKDSRFQYLFRPVMDLGGERVHDEAEHMLEKNTIHELLSSFFNPQDGRLPLGVDGMLSPGGSVCYAGKTNSLVIDPEGRILKCTCNLDDCKENEVGHLQLDGTLDLDESRLSCWLTEPVCQKDCFFAPICLGETCPAQRVVHKLSSPGCPHEKNSLPETLILLDGHNQCFVKMEDLQHGN